MIIKQNASLVASYLNKKYGFKTKDLGDGLTEIVI